MYNVGNVCWRCFPKFETYNGPKYSIYIIYIPAIYLDVEQNIYTICSDKCGIFTLYIKQLYT